MGSIDRIDWHFGGDFPDHLPEENAGTHIGFYINWLIDNDLIGEFLTEECPDEIQAVKDRKMTGREFFIDCCDGKLFEDMLTEEGFKFTHYYYEDGGKTAPQFLADYIDLLGVNVDSIYEVDCTWENYATLQQHIDGVYNNWLNTVPIGENKKWWAFWK